jgi:aminopeptidase N
MKKTKILIFILLFSFVFSFSQEKDIYQRKKQSERSRDYDVIHYLLKFQFDEKNKTYWGETTITLFPLKDNFRNCILDASDFTVTSVLNSQKAALSFQKKEDKLTINLDKSYNYGEKIDFIIKYYEKNPKTGLIFVDASPDHPAQINTYSWPEKAHYWFPCYDFPNDKATCEVIVTVQEDYKALSNGKLKKIDHDEKSNTKTYHYSQGFPISSYLITLTAGPYEIIQDSLDGLPVEYWVYKEDVPDAMRSFGKTPDMIAFFSQKFGFPYPWAKYAQICIAGYGGGMENVSATILGDSTIHDQRAEQDFSSHSLVAHELAHQWWGDTVTERTWSHVWLSESFATYFEYLYINHDRGEDEGAVNLKQKKDRYLREAHHRYIRPIVFDRYNNPWDIMDAHSYPKGAAVLHMLRFVMGEKPFFRALNHFITEHTFQVVDTHDFMTSIKESTGQNLDWFFEQWIFKPGHPLFEIKDNWNPETRELTLNISQKQDFNAGIPVFKSPVFIEVTTDKQKISKKIWIDKKENFYTFKIDSKPLMVRFDKGNFLLKEWTFEKTKDELLFQLKNDDVIGRMWAASELVKHKTNPDIVTALIETAQKDTFWSVRQSAVKALGEIKNTELIPVFKEAYKDENSKVRAETIRALVNHKRRDLTSFFKKAFLQDDSYLVQAETLAALGKCGDPSAIPFLEKAKNTDSPRNILKRAAERALETINSK